MMSRGQKLLKMAIAQTTNEEVTDLRAHPMRLRKQDTDRLRFLNIPQYETKGTSDVFRDTFFQNNIKNIRSQDSNIVGNITEPDPKAIKYAKINKKLENSSLPIQTGSLMRSNSDTNSSQEFNTSEENYSIHTENQSTKVDFSENDTNTFKESETTADSSTSVELRSKRTKNVSAYCNSSPEEPFFDSGSEYFPTPIKKKGKESTSSAYNTSTESTHSKKNKRNKKNIFGEKALPLSRMSSLSNKDAKIGESEKSNPIEYKIDSLPSENEKSALKAASKVVGNEEENNSKLHSLVQKHRDNFEEREKIRFNIARKHNESNKIIRDKCHMCFFCDSPIKNCARHLELVHSNELQVARTLAKPKRSRERKEAFAEIIRAGDFLHNCNVLATKTGELVLVRRPSLEEAKNLSYASYGPCPECLGFMVKKQIWRHLKYFCPKNKNNDFDQLDKGRRPIQESTALLNGIFSSGGDNNFKTEILDKLRLDEIGTVCKNDGLIKKYGYFLFQRFGTTQLELIRQSMRQLGRLLIELKKIDSDICTLSDSLSPSKFDKVVQATRLLCEFDNESVMKPEFRVPSLALKIGHSLKKCLNIERGSALRAGDMSRNETFLNFGRLLEMEWCTLISSNALSTLHNRKFNNTELLPLTSDITKLSRYLDSEIKICSEKLDTSINNEFSLQLYFRLSRLTLCKIVVFNKRRSGEASKMTVGQYLSRPEHANVEVFAEALTPLEQKLASKLAVVEILGKRGRKVPVLMTADIIFAINLLIRYRSLCNIPSTNPYVFAPANSPMGHFRGHDCLKYFCDEADLEKPENITSTKLRKYVATVAQIFNMEENEYDWLARHMGHDVRVHREFYRLHQNTIELTKVSKLLLAIDSGNAKHYAGKSLKDISLEDIDEIGINDEVENDDDDELENTLSKEPITSEMESERLKPTGKVKGRKLLLREKKQTVKKPWNNEEINAVLKYFKIHIKKKILPGKKDCEQCQIKHSVLSERPWTDIKFYIKNHYTRQTKLIKNK